jgi:hypothetical protein
MGDQMWKDEMGRTCSTNGGCEKCIQNLVGHPKTGERLGNLGLDGRIILKLVFTNYDMRLWTGFTFPRYRFSVGPVSTQSFIF